MSGKELRLKRIFKEDGKTVISALDFGGFMGPVPGLEAPLKIVDQVVRGGADALIMNPGFARETVPAYGGKAGLILRITGGASRFSPDGSYHTLISSCQEAVRLGADAVCVMVFLGTPQEQAMLSNLGQVVQEAVCYGLPVVAEILPHFEHSYEAEWLGVAARLAFELGADLVKTYYSQTGFEEVLKNCPIPLVMAGGPKNSEIFKNIEAALAFGAAGVAIGRNIFQSPDPYEYTRKIVRLVHGKSGGGDGK